MTAALIITVKCIFYELVDNYTESKLKQNNLTKVVKGNLAA